MHVNLLVCYIIANNYYVRISTGLYYKKILVLVLHYDYLNLPQHQTWWPSLQSPCHSPYSSSEGKNRIHKFITATTSI
jgi:hypothetical protein